MKKTLRITLIVGVILFVIILILLKLGLGLSIFDVFSQKLPETDTISASNSYSTQTLLEADTINVQFQDSYFLKKSSYFEKQDKNQCGGYSSAYVLRYLGEDIKGKDAYDNLGRKLSNGYVLPQALTDLFSSYGYHSRLYRGDLEQLKMRLSQGNPIIILIGDKFNWQHYVTVVGYDKDSIYFYDSNKDTDNSKGYNRIMSSTEFIDLWENEIPLFERIYFVVE